LQKGELSELGESGELSESLDQLAQLAQFDQLAQLARRIFAQFFSHFHNIFTARYGSDSGQKSNKIQPCNTKQYLTPGHTPVGLI